MKNFIIMVLLCLFVSSFSNEAFAQDQRTQTIRGKLTDEQSESPLIGANVILVGSDPFIGSSTDLDGNFRLENVPLGRQTIRITYLGYEPREIPNVLVTSGKELVLNLTLRESIAVLNEVIIEGKTERGEAINKMATVSSRTFTVEETKRYAGAIDDPSRMASSYAGVGVVDGNNDLVIRGNSPQGMLWRMEGVEIPNPNHFSEQGSSGGPISMLNSNMMTTSEFFTGAFPAEYGNGFSGVFDINLRKGNNEQREYAFQVGILGTDFALEGPFSKNYNGSYLVNYRYSTLSMFNLIGLDIVGDIVPKFQDLSFNFDLPSKKFGTFGLFGLGGTGMVTDDWRDDDFGFKDRFQTDMGVTGLRHSYLIGSKTLIKTVIAGMGTNRQYYQLQYDTITGNTMRETYNSSMQDGALRMTTSVNHKFNARHTLKSGIVYNHLTVKYFENTNFEVLGYQVLQEADGNTNRWHAYAQWQYRMNARLTLNSGLHYTYFQLTNEHRAEPRLGAKYQIDEHSSINAGVGVHSKSWDMSTYFATAKDEQGSLFYPNKQVGMLTSYHYVLGYDRMITKNLRAKVEAYYQQLENVPIVDNDSSFASMVNTYGSFVNVPMKNKGSGQNYGLEFTLERYFTNQFFFMLTSSIYNSTYVGGDGVRRNTVNNGNYVSNAQFGKEWNIKGSANRVFGISAKGVWAGGRRSTPILLDESRDAGHTVYDHTRGYENKMADYLRPDIQITYRINGKKASHLLKLDVQNAINRKNPWSEFYNAETGKIEENYQVGILPVMSYKIQF